MTVNNQPKVPMSEAKSIPDLGASQGARRATADAPRSAAPAAPSGDSAEVVPRAQRRKFSNAEKRRILQAADACTQPGEIGALMRREGVYSSSLSTWRRQREMADLAALAPQKRGCRRRLKFDPPSRLNFDPGREAGREPASCG